MPWKLKLNEDGVPMVKDELPVFVDDDGKESVIDPNQMHSKILQVNQESKTRRERLKELEKRLAPVEDIEDLESFISSANEALATVQNLEDAKLVEAGEVEKLKAEAIQGLQKQEKKLKDGFAQRETQLQAEIDKHKLSIRQLLISNRFASNELFSGVDRKTHLTPDVAEARFGAQFDVIEKNGKPTVVGRGLDGEIITSQDPQRFGEHADFDEAMDIIFNQYPNKDQLLRPGHGGSGASGGSDGVGSTSQASKLKRQIAEALNEGRVEEAVALKTRLFDLQKHGG